MPSFKISEIYIFDLLLSVLMVVLMILKFIFLLNGESGE